MSSALYIVHVVQGFRVVNNKFREYKCKVIAAAILSHRSAFSLSYVIILITGQIQLKIGMVM